ncbi:MAG: hypothetical protein LC676_01320 [Loktanella sp.]|nr:hypothetical protein [Loktanella sp.]
MSNRTILILILCGVVLMVGTLVQFVVNWDPAARESLSFLFNHPLRSLT